MAIFSNRNSSPQNPAPADAAADKGRVQAGLVPSAEDLRRRARHRLIGSAVLVVAAVILFPLIFDSEPRTVSPTIPIVMDDRIDTVPTGSPAARVDVQKSLADNEEIVADAGSAQAAQPAADDAASRGDEAAQRAEQEKAAAEAEKEAEARRKADEEQAARQAEADRKAAEKRAADKKAQERRLAEQKAAEKRAADKKAAEEKAAEARLAQQKAAEERAAQQKAAREAEAEKQRALAEQKAREAEQRKLAEQKAREEAQKTAEKPAVTYDFPEKGRFVVQVGAFVEDARVAETRRKLSAAGISNFTQKVKIGGKEVTRVRMGPFTTRKEMERVAAKVKALGLPVSMYSY